MKVGVAKEIKDKENRIALTPAGARELVARGHEVVIERSAGVGSGFDDASYESAGAKITDAAGAWKADMVMKVKEPLESEYPHMGEQILFTYLHLSGVAPSLTTALLEKGTTGVAYETVEDDARTLPLLAPMSAIAGDIATLVGAYYLARFNGGKGVLLGRVQGKRHGKVLVVGDGVVGRHAAHTAYGMGAEVYVCGRHEDRIPELRAEIGEGMHFVQSNAENIAMHLRDTDLLVGGVLLRGARAPKVITDEMVASMAPGSVVTDVSIDQGGCVATARATSHSNPVYRVHDVTHYCVTNMPGAFPRTSTIALTDATLPYALRLADGGLATLAEDPGFAKGVNTHRGHICYRPVAEDLGLTERFAEFAG